MNNNEQEDWLYEFFSPNKPPVECGYSYGSLLFFLKPSLHFSVFFTLFVVVFLKYFVFFISIIKQIMKLHLPTLS